MSQKHISRTSTNRYIDRIWSTQNLTDGIYKATPDGCWDLIVLLFEDGSKRMMLTGQASKTSSIPYQAGTGSVVISFSAGTYMPQRYGRDMLDLVEILPTHGVDHFELSGKIFNYPTYDNAEQLVQAMDKEGMLAMDDVVAAILHNNPKATSNRTAQRHFIHKTGLSKKSLEQIHRAQKAASLLQSGMSASRTATEVGYSDQPHMTKSLKKIMSSGQRDIDDIHKL